jgi:LysM repeat protein
LDLPGFLIPRFSFVCFLLSCLLAPAAWGEFTHVVKNGESLTVIARKNHLPVSRIQEANHLEEDKIVTGNRLVIPKKPPGKNSRPQIHNTGSPVASITSAPETHAVKKGDTLFKVARRYHLRVKDLAELNELHGGKLKTGQVLRLRREPDRRQELETDQPELKGDGVQAANEDPDLPRLEKDQTGKEGEGNKLLQVARKFLGVKYRRGGTSPVHGLDCSGYVQKVFQTVGFDLPRTAREQFGVGLDVARDALRLGDLVFFKRQKDSHPSHVGIYLGNQKFIHSSVGKRKVNIDSLETRYYSARFIGGKRIRELKPSPGAKDPDSEGVFVWENRFEPPLFPPDLPPSKQDY